MGFCCGVHACVNAGVKTGLGPQRAGRAWHLIGKFAFREDEAAARFESGDPLDVLALDRRQPARPTGLLMREQDAGASLCEQGCHRIRDHAGIVGAGVRRH